VGEAYIINILQKQFMRKVQFGCGGNRLSGWENYDYEVDISKPLPFENDSVDAILAEHVLEHITIHQAWNFIEECYRILKKGGLIRIAVPSVSRIFELADQEYFDFIKNHGWGQATLKDSVKSIIFNHDHKTMWDQRTLNAIVSCMGFNVLEQEPDLLRNTLNHHRVIGEKINNIETIKVDCKK
jgi:predicted SAM-dependent methyltransferase